MVGTLTSQIGVRDGQGRQKRRRARSGSKSKFAWLLSLLVPAVIIALWQYAGTNGLIADGLFPSATKSLAAFWEWIFGDIGPSRSGRFLEDLWASVVRVLVGFALGSVIGIIAGIFSGAYPLIRRLIDPMINALRPISITAWVPLTLIVFGIGNTSAFFLVGLATFFPVYVNAYAGARGAEGNLIRAARMLGANRSQVLRRVIIPASLPSIVTGLRVAAGLAWTCVVVVEILGAKSGIGYTLIQAYQTFQFPYVVAAMIGLGICGFLTDQALVLLLERRLKWVSRRSQA